ncbi:rna-directed dna polymerase from mobile element jockey-like [Limosa lapponica baueri]|uniref:Rna-directed dna polymerase from mobile element jockey-like n=1 Tax=Limosa lapponica baueri TaxID=1758121 RepID=A0A2I0ULK1_LIMLA|nr:rna-directed dna polymerase from mobile element jockey-like [Limosa lapponica baueri]
MSKWESVTSGVPQGLVPGPVLFNIFVGNMDSGIECTLSKFVNDTSCVAQLNCQMPSRGTLTGLRGGPMPVKFNRAKCKVLYLRQGNPKHTYRLSGERVESSPEKDLGVLADQKLKMSWQCVLAAISWAASKEVWPAGLGK